MYKSSRPHDLLVGSPVKCNGFPPSLNPKAVSPVKCYQQPIFNSGSPVESYYQSPCKPSPVAINNLERSKYIGLFRSHSPSPSKTIRESHPQVYTLKGSSDKTNMHSICFSPCSEGGAKEEDRGAYSLEELAENGIAREVVSRMILKPSEKIHHWDQYYLLRDSENKNVFRMFQEKSKEFILSARKDPESRAFYISQYHDVPEIIESHAFCAILKVNNNRDNMVQLFSTKCEHCDETLNKLKCSENGSYARQHLADIYQSEAYIADADIESRRVKCELPTVLQDQSVIWCPRADKTCSMEERNKNLTTNFPNSIKSIKKIENMLPHWSTDIGSLILKFQERRVQAASTKNILIIDAENPSTMLFQFGKESKRKFNLDFKHPLSPIQAFGIGLSMFLWKVREDK